MLHVLSTGYTNTLAKAAAKVRCIESVMGQVGVEFRHEYIEASLQSPCKGSMQNEYEAIMRLDPDDIVVQVDGDDWLAHPGVLARIAAMYDADPELWLTYGSFMCTDGRPTCCSRYETEHYRKERWRGSHLKTFRAALGQKLSPSRDLMRSDGSWRDLALDHCTMLPLLEMSGKEHQAYIPDVLYVYNVETSWEANASAEQRALEWFMANEIRELEPHRRLKSL